MFQNLTSSAIKYSYEKGMVTIGAQKLAKHAITFFVKNQGLGIPQAQQKRIFEKFFRADNVLTTNLCRFLSAPETNNIFIFQEAIPRVA